MTTPIQQLGRVSRAYEALATEYAQICEDAATDEAGYRKTKALHMTRSMADGASAAKAETLADADDEVSQACLAYKLSAAKVAATAAKLRQLHEQVAVGRSVLVSDREQDRIHASGTGGAS